MGEAYELLLEKILQEAHQGGAFLHRVIKEVRVDSMASGKLGEEEMGKLKKYVERDLVDAAQYRDKTGKELKYWLGFDLALTESALWEKFSAAADKTTVELAQIKLQTEIAEYHKGVVQLSLQFHEKMDVWLTRPFYYISLGNRVN